MLTVISCVTQYHKPPAETLSAKTVPRMRAKPKIYPTVQEPVVQEANCEDRKTLRRSNGVSTFSNVLLFRTCMSTGGNHNIKSCNGFFEKKCQWFFIIIIIFFYVCTEQGFTPAMALLDSPKNRSESCKTQLERLKRWVVIVAIISQWHSKNALSHRLKCSIILYLKKKKIRLEIISNYQRRPFCNFVKHFQRSSSEWRFKIQKGFRQFSYAHWFEETATDAWEKANINMIRSGKHVCTYVSV